MTKIVNPIKRSKLRQKLGREYFILKRKYNWLFGIENWTNQSELRIREHSVFRHQSMILRPLKDVDMWLQENKRTNLRLAIEKLNNTVIRPGEVFSLWKQVGRPSKRKGYLEGLILNQGKVEKGTGGGLCQLGNLLFWIIAHSPLSVKERHRHGFDVFPDVNRKVPFGAGATLAYNYIDFQIKNNTDHDFQIKLWLDEKYLNGELFCSELIEDTYEVEERKRLITQQSWGGYSRHNQIVKIKTDPFGHKTEALLVENHAIMMYNPFLTENKKT